MLKLNSIRSTKILCSDFIVIVFLQPLSLHPSTYKRYVPICQSPYPSLLRPLQICAALPKQSGGSQMPITSPISPHRINRTSSHRRQRQLHRVACGRDQARWGGGSTWLGSQKTAQKTHRVPAVQCMRCWALSFYPITSVDQALFLGFRFKFSTLIHFSE